MEIGARWLFRHRQEGNMTGLYLHGAVGCGKSVLMDLLATKVRMCRYTAANELPGKLKKSNDTFREFIHGRSLVEMTNDIPTYTYKALYIDDVGTEPLASDYGVKTEAFHEAVMIRSDLIRRRGSAVGPLLITSNLPMTGANSIESRYGARVVSRIQEMCFVVGVDGPDRRGETKGQL